MNTTPIESFADAVERFPGIQQLDPQVVGRFVFHVAGNFPSEFYAKLRDSPYWSWEKGENAESWKHKVGEMLFEIQDWRTDKHTQEPKTRLELAQEFERGLLLEQDTNELRALLPELNASEGFRQTAAYLLKWNFKSTKQLAPSPLFPDGRLVKQDIQKFIDTENQSFLFEFGTELSCDGVPDDQSELNTELLDYAGQGNQTIRLREKLQDAIEDLDTPSPEQMQDLRLRYGAKAANLLILDNILKMIYQKVEDSKDWLHEIKIPDFKPVTVDMFNAWLTQSVNFEHMLECVRLDALPLAAKSVGGLVAVRSSAVFSEDGQDHTGAGIYHSAVVDPEDNQAFKEAVTSVYRSVDSPAARAYQLECGVSHEYMGLLLQTYVEELDDYSRVSFGYVNSCGAHPNIVEAHTNHGTLLFDKVKIAANLLQVNFNNATEYLHTIPDHDTKLSRVVRAVPFAIQAALLAETIFSGAVQVEFAAHDSVVQVRPLPRAAYEGINEVVEFPNDHELLAELKASTPGDMTLAMIDEYQDDETREGFAVFHSEHGFIMRKEYRGFSTDLPAKGAVIILHPSYSGHIQTLCQERGLMCFYPDDSSEVDALEKLVHSYERRNLIHMRDGTIADESPLSLRFVSDGYTGRIYRTPPEAAKSEDIDDN